MSTTSDSAVLSLGGGGGNRDHESQDETAAAAADPRTSQLKSSSAEQRHTRKFKLLVENEFLFCLRALETAAVAKHAGATTLTTKSTSTTAPYFHPSRHSGGAGKHHHQLDSRSLGNLITKNDQLYRVLKYLVHLFEKMPVDFNEHGQPIRVNSWAIYSWLRNIKFDSSGDKNKCIGQSTNNGKLSLNMLVYFNKYKRS